MFVSLHEDEGVQESGSTSVDCGPRHRQSDLPELRMDGNRRILARTREHAEKTTRLENFIARKGIPEGRMELECRVGAVGAAFEKERY
jgi:hypothetical protein